MAVALRPLVGIVDIECQIRLLTGLHIGAAESSISIGGMDNPVVRDPITNRPYIPGSSVKGKARSLLERRLGLEQNWAISDINIHACGKDRDAYEKCRLCQVFGIPAPRVNDWFALTRVRVADVFLTDESARVLEREADVDLPYTEVKTEAAIDRVTSAATPRSMERVPAGAVFGPARITLLRYEGDPADYIDLVAEGLELIQADYLGGSGSRGSGRVAFEDIRLRQLRLPRGGGKESSEFPTSFSGPAALRAGWADVQRWLGEP